MTKEDIIKEVKFNDARTLFDYLLYGEFREKYKSAQFLFRGLPSDKYDLNPSTLRESNFDNLQKASNSVSNRHIYDPNPTVLDQLYIEYSLLRSFYQYCNEFGYALPNIKYFNDIMFEGNHSMPSGFKKWVPEALRDLAALAQHYGISTRLLDWSTDVLTALFFACKIDNINPPENIVLWILNPYMMKFISNENENFPLKIVYPHYHNNRNVIAQRGLFTLWELDLSNPEKYFKEAVDRRPLDELLIAELPKTKDFSRLYDGFIVLQKIIIPTSIIDDVKRILTIFNYNEARIFPGYTGVADWIMNGSSPKPNTISIGGPIHTTTFYT